MPLLRINATPDGLGLHGSAQPLSPVLAARATGAGPVVIMIHGYRFAPGAGPDCPHRHILSLSDHPPHWKALSWPRALGFGPGPDPAPGLGIAFGWQALGSLWQAYDQAQAAGQHLAALIGHLHRLAPHRPIHLIGHSMGARVILSALCEAPAHSVHRALLLAPAAYGSQAHTALHSPAGARAELFVITSRENAPYDALFGQLIAPPQPKDRLLGRRLPQAGNLLGLRLDDPATLDALAARGLPVAPPQRRICHWSAYLRPGVFDLYRALLFQPQRHPLGALRAALPAHPQPRLTWPARLRPALPFAQKAPS